MHLVCTSRRPALPGSGANYPGPLHQAKTHPIAALGAMAPDAGGVIVEGPWRGVPCQGDAFPLRDQRQFPVPVHRDPEAPAGSVPGAEDGTGTAGRPRDADPVLAGARLDYVCAALARKSATRVVSK
jgi:hypothetical protein